MQGETTIAIVTGPRRWICDWGVPGTEEVSGAQGEKDVEGDDASACGAPRK